MNQLLKRNPAPATSPSAAIDLTPLLDVIFILLFAVLLSFVQLAEQTDASLEQQVEDLQEELKKYQSQQYDYDTVVDSYKESIQQYEELDRILSKVTIYCNYDQNEVERRTICVLVPGREEEIIQLYKDHEENGYARLKTILEDFIKDKVPVRSEENELSKSTDETCFVVLYLSLDGIQRGDRIEIDNIATALMEKYENVYYKKTRAD